MSAAADALPPLPLPPGVRSRLLEDVNGLRMHVLEAGHEDAGGSAGQRPLALLLHGFPELAFSWRKVLPALAAAGWHAVAPDLRGYGRTVPMVGAPSPGFGDDLGPYRMTNRLLDLLCLLSALGRGHADALIGHDHGAWVAGYAALARPDAFRRLAAMSAPLAGAPPLPIPLAALRPPAEDPIHAALAALSRPREHYHRYYATPAAAADMDGPPERVGRFLRAYFHHKSADWPGNRPHPLSGWTAEALAELPTYYVMDAGRSMPDSVLPEMPADGGAACAWLTPAELAVYAAEYARTGFQGPLQGYRCRMDGSLGRDLALHAGRRVEVPALFVAGTSDWGTFQGPGALERMRTHACADLRGVHLVEGAGHWVQQERAAETVRLLLGFLGEK